MRQTDAIGHVAPTGLVIETVNCYGRGMRDGAVDRAHARGSTVQFVLWPDHVEPDTDGTDAARLDDHLAETIRTWHRS